MTTDYDYIIWRITESEEELRASLDHPEYFAQKTETLKPGSRRLLEVLAVRRAMKELFEGEEQQVIYDDEGKPSLLQPDEGNFRTLGVQISISHTRDYVAVVSGPRPVGIDIERRGTRVQKVVSHFLRHEELALLTLQDDPDLCLHLAWSAKEAAYKVLGKAYYDLMNLTTVSRIDLGRRTMQLDVANHTPFTVQLDWTEDYVLAIVEE